MTPGLLPPSRSSVLIEPDPLGPPFSSNEPFRSPYSQAVSVVSALVLMASLGAILWFSATLPKLQRLEEPHRALDLMVSRMMEAQDGLREAPPWQQWITEWTAGDNQAERDQAMEWYRELVQSTGHPESRLRLAILQGESGRDDEALKTAATWTSMGPPMPLYAELVIAAYGPAPVDPVEQSRGIELQSALAEALPAGWFYNALAARLAQRANDQALLSVVEAHRAFRGAQLQRRSGALLLVELSCLIAGTGILLHMMRRRPPLRNPWRLPVPGMPPPWPGGIGMAVLLRGGALGAVLMMVFLVFGLAEHTLLHALAIPVANLPLLVLAYTYLLKPAGLTFADGFGLRVERAQFGRLVPLVLVVVAVGLWGECVMARLTEILSLNNHWTEWFDPDLVWAPPPVLAISLLEYVVFAPIFEELAFRGLLFALFRRRLTFLPAALLSASLFALAHGYGWIGFLSVLWSGVLWAWLYEKTGSLMPGMIAHATNNVLVCLAVMALLR